MKKKEYTLFGPEALLEQREDMMIAISSLLAEMQKYCWLQTYCTIKLILKINENEKCLCEYFVLFLVVSAIDAN